MRAWRLVALGVALALVLSSAPSAALAADRDTGSIVGVVVVEAGAGPARPIAGAEVRLSFGSKSEARRTGADGRYTFGDLLPGRYTVKVTPPDGLRNKGDGQVVVTLSAGETERADFAVLAAPTPPPAPTAAPAPSAAAVASPPPAVDRSAVQPGVSSQSAGQPGGPSPSVVAPTATPIVPGALASGVAPSVVVPYASPSPATQPARAGQPGGPASAVAVASPAPILIGTPGLLVAAASPTPQPSPTGSPTPGGDVLANEPPRRLITSFAALREAGPGTASQLKSWATETSLVLGVPFRTQIDGTTFSLVNCGPASLAMVLIAFGLDVDPPSIRDYLNYLVGNYDAEQGTSLYVLARIAREAGLHTFGTSSGLQGWTIEDVREQIRAGHPVITLTKYRFLPGHFGSVTDFDHYIVITGLAGEDFVYNDAAYSTEYGYNLLISPAQLERAWAASSVPRHAVAIGFGDSLRPLPIVPSRLTAESLAATAALDEAQVAIQAPIRAYRGPAAEWLREQMLDRLGARTTLVDGEPFEGLSRVVPPTRLDPAEVGVQERPASTVVADPVDLARLAALHDGASAAEARLQPGGSAQVRVVGTGQVVVDREGAASSAVLLSLGLGFVGLGSVLVLGGSLAGWWRRAPRMDVVPAWAAGVAGRWLPPRRWRAAPRPWRGLARRANRRPELGRRR